MEFWRVGRFHGEEPVRNSMVTILTMNGLSVDISVSSATLNGVYVQVMELQSRVNWRIVKTLSAVLMLAELKIGLTRVYLISLVLHTSCWSNVNFN